MAAASALFVSHEWTLTGAPLFTLHLAALHADVFGGPVAVVGLLDGQKGYETVHARAGAPAAVRLAPAALDNVAGYRWVVLNTAVAHSVGGALVGQMGKAWAARHLIWWIHEIHPRYARATPTGWATAVAQCVFDSEASRRAWRHTAIPAAKTSVVHPALGGAFVRRAADPAPKGQTCTFLCVGTVMQEKGQLGVVRAFARLGEHAPQELRIVGFGPPCRRRPQYENRLYACRDALPRSIRRRVTFVERCADVHEHYAAASVFVHNAGEPGENFGLVLLEAMAHALPVVASDAGGAREIVVPGETGALYAAGDLDALTAALRRAGADEAWRVAAGRRGRARYQVRFSEARMAAEWKDLLAAL